MKSTAAITTSFSPLSGMAAEALVPIHQILQQKIFKNSKFDIRSIGQENIILSQDIDIVFPKKDLRLLTDYINRLLSLAIKCYLNITHDHNSEDSLSLFISLLRKLAAAYFMQSLIKPDSGNNFYDLLGLYIALHGNGSSGAKLFHTPTVSISEQMINDIFLKIYLDVENSSLAKRPLHKSVLLNRCAILFALREYPLALIATRKMQRTYKKALLKEHRDPANEIKRCHTQIAQINSKKVSRNEFGQLIDLLISVGNYPRALDLLAANKNAIPEPLKQRFLIFYVYILFKLDKYTEAKGILQNSPTPLYHFISEFILSGISLDLLKSNITQRYVDAGLKEPEAYIGKPNALNFSALIKAVLTKLSLPSNYIEIIASSRLKDNAVPRENTKIIMPALESKEAIHIAAHEEAKEAKALVVLEKPRAHFPTLNNSLTALCVKPLPLSAEPPPLALVPRLMMWDRNYEQHHIDLHAQLPDDARRIIFFFYSQQHYIWLTGGGVRDALAGHPVYDCDFLTTATFAEINYCFRNLQISAGHAITSLVVTADPEGSSINFEIKGNTYTIVPRARSSHPSIPCFLRENAQQRDATVNALFWDPRTRTIHDYCGGVADLKQRRMKIIGDPEQRFNTSPIIPLRTIRIANKLQLSISKSAERHLYNCGDLLYRINTTKLTKEYNKWLTCLGPKLSYALLEKYGLTKHVLERLVRSTPPLCTISPPRLG